MSPVVVGVVVVVGPPLTPTQRSVSVRVVSWSESESLLVGCRLKMTL